MRRTLLLRGWGVGYRVSASRVRFVALVAATVLAPLAGSPSAFAVEGGQPASIASAPWAVFVQDGSGTCSGSILDSLHVLTAAHCVIDDATGVVDDPAQVTVEAGVSNFRHPGSADAAQIRRASSVRVFPEYVWSSDGYELDAGSDIAVIRLVRPLKLGGPDAREAALPAVKESLPRRGLTLAGFGEEKASGAQTGALELIHTDLWSSARCGMLRALCASSPSSSLCPGDSGSGLVNTGAVPTILGVAVSSTCAPGSEANLVDLRAPEIHRFILGALGEAPPWRPRATRWVPSGWVSEDYHGVSLSLPHEWDAYTTSGRENLWSPETEAQDFVYGSAAPSRQAYFQTESAKIVTRLANVDPGAASRSRVSRLPSGTALEIIAHYVVHQHSQTFYETMQSYLSFDDGKGYDVEYLCPISKDADELPVFDESARTIHFVNSLG